jgi:hypothetical protein
MHRARVTLEPLHKRILYLSLGILWLSGLFWLYLKFFGQVQGAFGPQSSPWQAVWMRIHGALAMVFLILFGTLLTQHVPWGWKRRQQRPSGVTLLVISAVLIVTGWGLYYLVNEGIRHWVGLIHWGLGLLFPALIAFHVILGKSKT